MTPAEALRDAKGYASANRIAFSPHARLRMRQRGAVVADVVHAIVHAVGCVLGQSAERWEISGPDLDGDELTAIVVFEGGVLVVTMF